MRKLLIVMLMVGMLIGAGCGAEQKVNDYPFSTFINEDGQEVGSATAKEFAAYEEAKENIKSPIRENGEAELYRTNEQARLAEINRVEQARMRREQEIRVKGYQEEQARQARDLANKFPSKKWPDQLAKLIPPEYYAAIRIFLLSHEAEFGLFNKVRLIGTAPNTGVTAYNVFLTNGRKLQFWFKADRIYIVGEEINGGFMAHYGRI